MLLRSAIRLLHSKCLVHVYHHLSTLAKALHFGCSPPFWMQLQPQMQPPILDVVLNTWKVCRCLDEGSLWLLVCLIRDFHPVAKFASGAEIPSEAQVLSRPFYQ